jgi:hypothetical protein
LPIWPGDEEAIVQEDLSRATAHWLAYKRAAGFRHASEGLLIIPLAECLAAKGYDLKTEADTTQYDVGTPGLFNYDAIAEKKDSLTILLETKYLKASSNVNRCLIDVLKLALPPSDVFQRLLIVAGEAANVERLAFEAEYSLDDLSNTARSDVAFGKFLEKFKAEASRPSFIFVESFAPVVANGVAARTFSVGRK